MEKIKQHSIFISLILYFGIALLLAEVIYLGVSRCIDTTMLNLLDPKPDSLIFQGNMLITLSNSGSPNDSMSSVTSPSLFQLLRIVKTISPILIFGVSILLAAFIYHKIKLKKQFDLLQYGMDKIANQDLDFKLECHNKDEIGMLCNSFDHMREELQNTFQKLWEAEEKQNLLFRAFTHDLRTPLTILKGNNDVIRYLLNSKDQKENIKKSLNLSDDAIQRIEVYTNALKNFKDIDQWELQSTPVHLFELKENLIHQNQIWKKDTNKNFEVESNSEAECYFDPVLIQLVLDKLIENAMRFAKSKVSVIMHLEDKQLTFVIKDNGDGFSPEALKCASDIFYSTDKARDHSGIGLAIANKLLDKYNSHIVISNSKDGGAVVSFSINVEN
ncbi:MAG: ATP-binding protein [Velocimicrobium sp.]